MICDEDMVFTAHESSAVGMQALGILERECGRQTIRMTGGNPCPPTGSTLLLLGPPGNYPGDYLRLHPLNPSNREDEVRMRHLLERMPWTLRAEHTVFIVPVHLGKDGVFTGDHLSGFERSLKQLCGYKRPKTKRPKVNWRIERQRANHQEARYGRPLWMLEN